MPYEKGYGLNKDSKMDMKKGKMWEGNLKGNPKPEPMYHKKNKK